MSRMIDNEEALKDNGLIEIDGIDVSGCEYRTDIHKELLADGKIKIFENYCQICNDGCYAIDCYYKQMQRLKAKNEELNRENETWREQVEKWKEICDVWMDLANNRKQALEEVREIANKRNVGCGVFCEVNRLEHNCNAECNAYYLAQIQDKINEVMKDE